jgi:neutral ceramidase
MRRSLMFMAGIFLLGSAQSGNSVFSQSLRVGMAEADITPPLGFPMAGYYHERLADGTRDPLSAKAVVFRDGERSAALVVGDLTGIARDLCVEVRRTAAARTGIDPTHIVVSATHSHTAPDYYHGLYEYQNTDRGKGDPDSYSAKLIAGFVEAIVEADKASREVKITAGSGQQQTSVSFNRRFVMKDGSVRTWQNMRNANVVRAAGPIDPEIALLMLHSADGETPVGVISNFALHLDTVGGNKWSADYPYYIQQRLRKKYGEAVISVFGLGACGDINHSDPNRQERNKTDVIGNSLADTIEATLSTLQPVDSPTLQVQTATVNLPLQEVIPQQLDRARQLIPSAKAGEKIDFFDLVSAHKSVALNHLRNKQPSDHSDATLSRRLSHTWAGVGDSLPIEVTTMTLGDDVAMVFLPGEVFVELGLAIKRGSPYRTTFVVELSGCVETMYIPTRGAYAGGGYEVINSAVEPGSGEMLVEAALKLLRTSASAPGG